ncbi:MAG TPA: hypothetical protein VN911_04770 [Candidatus Acidoferrum sp.]|nr:hypothetical protein [Candidatus Acidoferrum sp.]
MILTVDSGLAITFAGLEMKAEFSLTFEDFLECHSYRLKLSEPMLAGAVALVGLALIALGYILLRQGCLGVICGLVLFAGLATTALSVPIGLLSSFLRRREIDRRKATIKEEFDSLYMGVREFEADDSGWRFAFKDAQDIRVWKNLTGFREERQTFLMADDFVVYALPKSAIKEEFEKLRELCIQSLTLQNQIHSVPLIPSLGDFLAVSFSHHWRKRLRTMLALYSVGLLSVAFLWLVLTDALPGFGIAAALLPLLLPCIEAAYYWMQFEKGVWMGQFEIADISEDGICLRKGTLESTTNMFRLTSSRMVEVRENARAFMIYALTEWPYTVPKSQIPPEKMAGVRNSLFAHRNVK